NVILEKNYYQVRILEHRKDDCVKNVTVVGSGVMGKGIAYAFATGGFNVHLNDLNDDILAKAKESIDELLDFSHEKGFLKKEADIEKKDLKIDVFKQLDEICHADTNLATNTSTMSPTEIGAQTSRPDKVLAMHFFNPVHKMKLIEVIRGLDTSDETVNAVRE